MPLVVEENRVPPEYRQRKWGNLQGGKKILYLNEYIKKKQKERVPFAITGAPGSGKTFEIIKLYLDFKREFEKTGNWLPILIFINALPAQIFEQVHSGAHCLRDFVEKYLIETGYPEKVIKYIIANLYGSKVVFLFDALDELPNKKDYEKAIEVISEQFIQNNLKSHDWRFILSCRTEDYDSKLNLIELEIQPLSSSQIESFYKKNRSPNSRKEKERQQAWTRLNSGTIVWFQPYISNPYFLAIMLESISYDKPEEINEPTNLATLFDHTIWRELRKIDKIKLPIHFLESFKPLCSIICFLLMEKTSRGKIATFDLSLPEDLREFLEYCNELAKNNIEPFRSILIYIDHQFNSKEQSPNHFIVAKLSQRLADEDTVEILIDQSMNPDKVPKNLDLFKQKYPRHPICSFFDDETYTKTVNAISDMSNGVAKFIFNFICLNICISVLDVGIKRRLVKIDFGKKFVVRNFGHRRLMEYFAALYLDNRKIDFSGRSQNLWYKQTICILAAITSDLDWFFQTADSDKDSDLFNLVDACYFIHQNHAIEHPKYFIDIISRLEKIAFQPESSIHAYQALRGIQKLIMAGHLKEDVKLIKLSEQIIKSGEDISLFRVCTSILLDLDKMNVLNQKMRFSFLMHCFRNILSIKV